MQIEPLAGYIILKQVEASKMTNFGLYLAETSQERPAQGKVIAVGDDAAVSGGGGLIMACPVKVGDMVVYKKWGADELTVDGEEYKMVKFEDLMAILKEDKDATE